MTVQIQNETRSSSDLAPDAYWDYLIKNPLSIRKKIGIQLAGRSGSMLLSGLLDGHSEILTFNPYVERGLIHLLKNLSVNPAVTIETFAEFAVEILENLVQEFKNNPLAPAHITREYYVDTSVFYDHIKEICKYVAALDYDLIINIFYIAYGVTQKHALSTQSPLLLIQLHGRYEKDQMDAIWGSLRNAETLMVVRNPIKALDSQFYFHHHEWALPHWMAGYNRLIDWYKTCFNSFFYKDYQDNSFCICFEDIHQAPEKTMRALAQHLGIHFDEILLSETQDAKPMGIMSLGQNKHIINTSAERGKDISLKIFEAKDVAFIELFLKHIIEDLGYPLRSSRLQRLRSPLLISKLQWHYFKKSIRHIVDKKNEMKSNINALLLTKFDLKGKIITQKTLKFSVQLFQVTVICLLSASTLIRLIFDRLLLLALFRINRKKQPYLFKFIKPAQD